MIKVKYRDTEIQLIVLFKHGIDVVGRVLNDYTHLLEPGDLVQCEERNIFEVLPDKSRTKMKPFMLVTHPELDTPFVLHLQYPRMVAVIVKDGTRYNAHPAIWFDYPPHQNDAVQLLYNIGHWYYSTQINRKG